MTSTKFLGIFIDSELNWSAHIDHVLSKLAKSVGIINKVKSLFPISVLINLYFTLIYPHLLYCILVWGAADQKYLNQIKLLQNRALRTITFSKYRTKLNKLYKQVQCLKFEDIYFSQLVTFMFKVKNHFLPSVCNKYLAPTNRSTEMSLRRHYNLAHDFARSKIRCKHVSVAGPIHWESLSKELQLSNSLVQFKKNMHEWLLLKYTD